MGNITMHELTLIAFIKEKKLGLVNGKISTAQKACGIGGYYGNKGGIQMHFNLNNRNYNFIGVHL